MRTEVKLRVSLTGNPDDSRVVFTTAAAIVGQVERMDDKDRAALPIRVTLNTLPATQPGRNAAFILTLPGQTPESASVAAAAPTGDDDIPF